MAAHHEDMLDTFQELYDVDEGVLGDILTRASELLFDLEYHRE